MIFPCSYACAVCIHIRYSHSLSPLLNSTLDSSSIASATSNSRRDTLPVHISTLQQYYILILKSQSTEFVAHFPQLTLIHPRPHPLHPSVLDHLPVSLLVSVSMASPSLPLHYIRAVWRGAPPLGRWAPQSHSLLPALPTPSTTERRNFSFFLPFCPSIPFIECVRYHISLICLCEGLTPKTADWKGWKLLVQDLTKVSNPLTSCPGTIL